MYIHQNINWTDFKYSIEHLANDLASVRYKQGYLLGQMKSLGFSIREEAMLNSLTLDVLKTTEIEGEFLDKEQVRSSIARRLGIKTLGLVRSSRDIDGIVEMMLDATQRYDKPLTEQRFIWLACLSFSNRMEWNN